MATVFSTATLGLSVETREFNRALAESESIATRVLTGMQQQADTFSARWADMTHGIKDTKRIISGILMSQGFYAIMNAFTSMSTAALEFASSMEQASVSLEYFVDAATGTKEAATEVKAYLREVNEFAARTPFNTNEVLSLSKYMQAVGVEISKTQSVLTVLTDAAAATGASTEQLERITFAIGQIMTKGRLANEEIRQLANANIPIYEILQEELGLTGSQISNIGKYWVDANDSIVAILNGLEKRYQGAAERISETFNGVTDTIVDDAKIIANEAFSGLYTKLVDSLRTVRDTFDEWREIVNEFGSIGLARHIGLEIDPSGQFSESVLHIIGHLKNLKENVVALYHDSQPLLQLFGRAFGQTLQISIGAITGLIRVVDQAVQILNKLGVTTGTTADVIASLIVAYQSAKFVSLLGQAAASATMAAVNMTQAIYSIIPATIGASSGVATLTSAVLGLASAIGIVYALSNLSSSFSGLQGGYSGFEEAYQDYAKKMQDYNAAIDAYRDRYKESYKDLATDSDIKLKDNDSSSKKKGSGSGRKDKDTTKEWVAAFDEVYDVPNEDELVDEIGGGSTLDDIVTALGDIFGLLDDFKFPNWDKLFLEEPEMPSLFSDDLLNGDALKLNWKNFLPALILGAATALGNIFRNEIGKIKGVTAGDSPIPKGPKDLNIDPKVLDKALKQAMDAIDERLDTVKSYLDEYKAIRGKLLQGDESVLNALKAQNKLLLDEIEAIQALQGKGIDLASLKGAVDIPGIEGVADLKRWLLTDRLEEILPRVIAELEAAKQSILSGAQPGSILDIQEIAAKQELYQQEFLKLSKGTAALATKTIPEAIADVEQQIYALAESIQQSPFLPTKVSEISARTYKPEEVTKVLKQLNSIDATVKTLKTAGIEISDQAKTLYGYLTSSIPTSEKAQAAFLEKLDQVIAIQQTDADLYALRRTPEHTAEQSKLLVSVNRIMDNIHGVHTKLEGIDIRLMARQAEEARQAEIARKVLIAQQEANRKLEQMKAAREAAEERRLQQARMALADYNVQSSLVIRDLEDLNRQIKNGSIDWKIAARYLGDLDPAELKQAVQGMTEAKEQLAQLTAQRDSIAAILDRVEPATKAPQNITVAKQLAQTRGQLSDVYNALREANNLLEGKAAGITADEVYDALSSISARQLETTKILRSAFEGETDALGAAGVITKPYSATTLESAVENLTALTESLEENKEILNNLLVGPSTESVIKIGQLQEALEEATDGLNLFTEQYNYYKQINDQFFNDPTLANIYNTVKRIEANSSMSSVLADKLQRSASLQAVVAHRFGPAPGIGAAYRAAIEEFNSQVSPATKVLLDALHLTASDLMITGTHAVYAAQGLESFGGTLTNYIAETLNKAAVGRAVYAEALNEAASATAQLAADFGVAFEPYIRMAAAHGLAENAITMYNTGHAAAGGFPAVVQYDSAITGLKEALGTQYDMAFADIKFFKDEIVNAILSGAEQSADGFYTLNGTFFKYLGREKLMYQMLMQGLVANSVNKGAVENFMLLMSRDVDVSRYAGDAKSFLDIYKEYMVGNYRAGNGQITTKELEDIGGRIFSDDAFNAFKKIAGPTATVEDYRTHVIDQLLTDSRATLTLDELSGAVKKIRIIFDRDFVKALNLPKLTKRTHDMLETFVLLHEAKDAGRYLHNFAGILGDANKTLSKIDLAPILRNYRALARGAGGWAESILGIKGPMPAVGSTSNLATYIDNAVISYKGAIAAGKDAFETAEKFRQKLLPVYEAVERLKSGAKLAGDAAELLGNLGKASTNELVFFNKALGKLLEQPKMLDEATRLVTATQNQLANVSIKIATGSTDFKWSVNALLQNYTKLMNTMYLTNNVAAKRLGDAIQEVLRYANEGKVVPTDLIEQLQLPFRIVGAGDAMPYVAKEIGDAIQNGTLKLSKDTVARLTEIFSKYTLPPTTADSLFERALKNYTDQVLGTRQLGLDIETTGLPTSSRMPEISQIAVADMNTGEMMSSVINNGEANRRILLHMMNLTDSATGELSDVAKAWATWVDSVGGLEEAVKKLDAAPTLEQFWDSVAKKFGTGNVVTGYNATGAAGFDFNVLRKVGLLPDNLFIEGKDLMATTSEHIQQILGKDVRFRLSDLYEMLTGESTAGAAHMADYDVGVELKTLYTSLQDGTLDQMLTFIRDNSPDVLRFDSMSTEQFAKLIGPAKQAIIEGAKLWRDANAPVVDNLLNAAAKVEPLTRLTTPTIEGALPFTDVSRLLNDAGAGAAENITDAFVRGASQADDVLSEIVDKKPLWQSLKDALNDRSFWQRFKDLFSRTEKVPDMDAPDGIFKRFGAWYSKKVEGVADFATEHNPWSRLFTANEKINISFDDAYAALGRAQSDIADLYADAADIFRTQGFTAADEFLRSNQGIIDAYDKAAADLHRTMVTQISGQVKSGFTQTSDSLLEYLEQFDKTGKYTAIYYDKATGQLKFLGDKLEMSGTELSRQVGKVVAGQKGTVDSLKSSFSLLEGATDSGTQASVALQRIGQLLADTGAEASIDITSTFDALKSAIKTGDSAKIASTADALSEAINKNLQIFKQDDLPNIAQNLKRTFNMLKGTASDAEQWQTAIDTIRKTLSSTSFSTSDDIVAALGSIESAISQNGAGLSDAAKTAQRLLNSSVSDLSDDTLKAFTDFAEAAQRGSIGPEELNRLKGVLDEQLGDFVTVVNRATGDVEFAGGTAAKVFGQAGDDLANGIKSVMSKVSKATYGTLSVFDAIAIAVDTGLQVYSNYTMRGLAGEAVLANTTPEAAMAIGSTGIDVQKVLGSAVYTGVSEALARSGAITGISTGLGTLAGTIATTLGVAGGPAGWIAVGVAAAAGIIASVVAEKTGYNTNENIHYNEYARAVASGSYIDEEALQKALENTLNPLTGAKYTPEEIAKYVADTNEAARQLYARDILSNLDTGSTWERSKVTSIQHGNTGSAYATPNVAGVTANDALRIAMAMGLNLEGVSSRMRTSTATSASSANQVQYMELVADNTDALNRLKELLGNDKLHFAEGQTSGYVLDENNRRIAYSTANQDVLNEVYHMISTQGLAVGELAQSMLNTIQDTPALYKAYVEQVGSGVAFSQLNLKEVLHAFNEAAGTGYTVDLLQQVPGLANQIMELTGKAFESWQEKTNLSAGFRNAGMYDKSGAPIYHNEFFNNKDNINQQTRTYVEGFDLSKVAGVPEMLKEFGFAVEGATEKLKSGGTFDYSYLISNEEELWKNLRGVIIDTAGMAERLKDEGLKLDNLTVSASDAEILAQAGIKVYGNGDVAFAFNQANHTERTGSERVAKGFTLNDKGVIQELSVAVTNALKSSGITLAGNDKQTVDVKLDTAQISKDLAGAFFAMPKDIIQSVRLTSEGSTDAQTGQKIKSEIEQTLAEIGRITEEGYLEITNKQILLGETTITQVLQNTAGAYEKLSPELIAQLEAIDDVIQHGNTTINESIGISGQNVSENLTTYADAIRIISPLKKEQLTEEIKDAFAAIGITFTEEISNIDSNTQEGIKTFYMNIDKTGEFYQNSMSLISVDTWNKLDEDLRKHLEDMGVTAIQIGNQMCIDLSGVLDKGSEDIVAAFVDKPELWDQIPDEVKEQFTQAGIITDEELLVIQRAVSTKTEEILNGWVLSWSELAPEVKTALDNAGIETDRGLAQIVGIIDGSEVPEEIEGTVVVPFEALPDQIKQSLESTGLNMEGKKVRLKNAANEAFSGMTTELAAVIGAFNGGADEVSRSIDKLTNSFIQMQAIESQLKKGEYITGWNFKDDGSITVNVRKDGWFSSSESTINAGPNGVNRTKKKASGGTVEEDEYTIAGEKGKELAIFPDGRTALLGSGFYTLPAGTEILTAEETKEVQKYAGNAPKLNAFAEGTGLTVTTKSGIETEETDEDLIGYLTSEYASQEINNSARNTQLKTLIADNFETTWDKLDAIKNEIDISASDFAQVLRGSIEGVGKEVGTLGTNLKDIVDKWLGKGQEAKDTGETYGMTVDSIIAAAKVGWANATTDEERAAWHAVAEMARATQGYSGGPDGSQHIALKEATGTLSEAAAALMALQTKDSSRVEGLTWQDVVAAAQEGYAKAKTDEERAAWHNVAEMARASQGFSGGASGVGYQLFDETNKYVNELVTLAKNGWRLADNPEEKALWHTIAEAAREAVGTSGGADGSENKTVDISTESLNEVINIAKQNWQSATTPEEKALWHEVAEAARNIMGYSGGADGSQNIAITSALGEQKVTLEQAVQALKDLQGIMAEPIEVVDGLNWQDVVNAAKLGWSMATTQEEKDSWHNLAEVARAVMGFSGGAAGDQIRSIEAHETSIANAVYALETMMQKYTNIDWEGLLGKDFIVTVNGTTADVKGSAAGSLITKDALYRAGEFGLNEAIIPLERPSVMRQVGATIASFMPANAADLRPALGMENAGVSSPNATTYITDMSHMVDMITKGVLERVLPEVASMAVPDNSETTPINVGTLIADDAGLRMLERKLYTIRQAETMRRGH